MTFVEYTPWLFALQVVEIAAMRSRNALARNLKLLRKKLGLNQEQLAHLAGVDRGSISGLEGRKTSIGIDKLDKLADALQVTASDLIAERPTTPPR